jgi:asparagine synthase (glutamine-hydrolysing)
MFAFALWDEGERRLFLARDRMGKKPLLYAHHDGALSFASEMRALLSDGRVPRDVDPRAIDAFLACGYVPHEVCAFARVRKLPPASWLSWRPGEQPRVERYWHLEYGPKERVGPEEAAERVREKLLEATRIRLMSDVPIGAFLSGGVDSSAVVAAMAMSTPDTVQTFCASFPGTPVDEAPYARAVAARYGTEHHELEVGPVDASILPRLAWHFGEPFADPAALPSFQLSELVRRHVKVALNGDGGDESFAGYRRYHQLALTRAGDAVPAAVRSLLAARLERLAGGTDGRAPLPRAARLSARLALPAGRRYADLFGIFSAGERRSLYSSGLREAVGTFDGIGHVEAAWEARHGLGVTDRLMATDLVTYLADDLLPKADITSMANSIEVRSPLLDHELMAFAARLPERLKRRGMQGKLLLRDAVRPWLPDDLLDRPKQGFAVPLDSWLRDELRDLPTDLLLDPVARDRGLFEEAAVHRLIDDHRAGRDRALKLWAMINLEVWHRTCVDAPVGSAAGLAPA